MKQFEIFDGDRYILTVMPSDNPRQVLQDERYRLRSPQLRMVMVENGERTQVEGPGVPEPEEDEDYGYGEEE